MILIHDPGAAPGDGFLAGRMLRQHRVTCGERVPLVSLLIKLPGFKHGNFILVPCLICVTSPGTPLPNSGQSLLPLPHYRKWVQHEFYKRTEAISLWKNEGDGPPRKVELHKKRLEK